MVDGYDIIIDSAYIDKVRLLSKGRRLWIEVKK